MSMGSMKDGGGDEDIVAEINMTPLIDIMLVLLIIFMVSSTAALESGLDIQLPTTSAVAEKKEPELLVITLSKDGKYAVQGKKVTEQDLPAAIKRELATLKTETVILEGDSAAFLGKAVEVMDMARLAGAKNFSIAAEESTKK
ncbi:MAG: biopolymer transporter ExbD [Bacteriovoracaceae bacterium]|jgi:biopolymer transport protein ExbD|nr:biopolymer transporter ExbD [Bacteriovoracaceae bacterium]